MNVTEYLEECRDTLDDPVNTTDPDLQKWSNAELLRHGDRQAASLSRIQVEQDEGYHNAIIALPSTDAVEIIASSTWQWTLPSWVTNLHAVYERAVQSNPGAETTTYDWTEKPTLGRKIEKWNESREPGFQWDGNRELRLWGYASPPDIALQIAKEPAPMFTATLEATPASATKLYLPQSLTLGRLRREPGIFVNAEVEVVNTSDTTATTYGNLRRVTWSNPIATVGGVRRTELYFDRAFAAALEIGDQIETRIPYASTHARLLVLATCRAALEKTNNVEGLRAIADEYRDELRTFRATSKPRDRSGPDKVRSTTRAGRPFDEDRPFGGLYRRGSY